MVGLPTVAGLMVSSSVQKRACFIHNHDMGMHNNATNGMHNLPQSLL